MGNVKQLPKRNEVPVELTWDLTLIFSDDSAFEVALEKVKKEAGDLGQYQNTLNQGPTAFLTALEALLAIDSQLETVYVYANMKNDQDTANPKYQGYSAMTRSLAAEVAAQTAWFEPEVLQLTEEQINQYLADEPKLATYKHLIETITEQRAHVLSTQEEALLAAASDVLAAPENIFEVLNNADLKFPVVTDEQGEKVQLSHGVFGKLLESADRTVRKEAFEQLYSVYDQYKNTFAMTLATHVKKHNFSAKIRKYASAQEMSLAANHIPVDVYTTLLQQVEKNLPLLHRYVALRKKLLNLDEVHMYDIYAPLTGEPSLKYTYEEAKEKTIAVLGILGEDYLSHVKEAFSHRWIDVVENQGKRSGAYSSGVYGTAPYILLNWQDNLDNLFTLVHEMGHSMHSYLTTYTQPYHYGDYSIFLAEIASTTNENLLTQALLDEDLKPEVRAYVLNHYLDGFKGTVFRQAQFAEFELWIHEQDAQGIPLTAEMMSNYYAELNQKYYGPTIVNDPQIAYEWARIPHFYYNFYVYQYATGFAAATTLAEKIVEHDDKAIEAYLNYLSAGSSDYPIQVMQKAGVDMTDARYLEKAFAVFEKRLNELENLL
ncbi:oligoendopeptidase F [Ligilactobacillus ceti]|uniref:Oligopeptidase F n=1 Tax=Ligilactobacillus ceti DSM 22408 TaxID=1122146 RepID=A0A0R2KI66_9LACO|nr:oligoendopeptidase F [Ligilactobacillus ceti]KRN89075.1 oligoendopeptidase F [Ligilactobacillus ceti DSM 22408]